MTIDAFFLHRAGFALSDVVNARAFFRSLDLHPPKSRKTLFDSQLKLAGYTATDFRQIGYTACQMSSTHFYTQDPDMTEGEREWDEARAFFTVEELTQAGFDAEEVRIAFDREQYSPSIALDRELHWQYSPSRSRSSSHEPHRRHARFSEEYQRGYAAGHEHGVLSGAGRILRNP